jgi:hypothetical protein
MGSAVNGAEVSQYWDNRCAGGAKSFGSLGWSEAVSEAEPQEWATPCARALKELKSGRRKGTPHG